MATHYATIAIGQVVPLRMTLVMSQNIERVKMVKKSASSAKMAEQKYFHDSSESIDSW